MSKTSVVNTLILVVYLTLLIALTVGLWVARGQVLRPKEAAQARDQWQEWRSAAKDQQTEKGPVLRRVPKSEEPPTVVLLRDYFVTSSLILIVLSSAVYFAFALMLRGVLAGPKFEPNLDE
jgi:hypothetical protein